MTTDSEMPLFTELGEVDRSSNLTQNGNGSYIVVDQREMNKLIDPVIKYTAIH